ncbi:hypothetical protein N752_06585 [Desulforamulus aquiferis]|nr:hypothetical protein N752_06585 [Desulforamulus aquiferis]
MINKKFFDELPQNIQDILVESGKEALDYQRKISAELEAKAKQDFIAAGIKVHDLTPEEKAKFKEATKEVWTMFPDKIPQELIDMLVDAQK